MSTGGSEREVVIRLVLDTDRAAAGMALRDLTKGVTEAQEQVKRGAGDMSRQVQRTTEEQRKALSAATREYEKQSRIVAQTSGVIVGHFDKMFEGALKLTRGLALMGLASEENTGKLIRGLVKAQAYFDTFKGAYDVITRASRAWGAYTQSVRAASAAQSALGTIGKLTGGAQAVVGGSKVAGDGAVAGGVGSAVGGMAGGKLAHTSAAGLASTIAPAAAWVGAIGGTAFGAVSAWDAGGQAGKYGIGGGADYGSLTDKIASAEVRAMEIFTHWVYKAVGNEEKQDPTGSYAYAEKRQRKSREDARKIADWQRDASQSQDVIQLAQSDYFAGGHTLENAQAFLTTARANRDSLVSEGDDNSIKMQEAQTRILFGLDRVTEKEREALAIAQRKSRVKIRGIQEELSLLQRQHEIEDQHLQKMKDESASGAERFGGANALERARAIRSAQAVAGGRANEAQRRIAEQYASGDGAIREQIRQQRLAVTGSNVDYAATYGADYKQVIAGQETITSTAGGKAKKLSEELANMEKDFEQAGVELAETLKKLVIEGMKVANEQVKSQQGLAGEIQQMRIQDKAYRASQ